LRDFRDGVCPTGRLRATIQDALQTFYTAYSDAMGADSGLYAENWKVTNTTDALFSNYKTDLANQPAAWMPTYKQTDGFCQMMVTANIPGASCP
jgi:hypothetical protein